MMKENILYLMQEFHFLNSAFKHLSVNIILGCWHDQRPQLGLPMLGIHNKIYAIVDQQTCDMNSIRAQDFTRILIESGIGLIQYRNKKNNLAGVRSIFGELVQSGNGNEVFIINDYEEIAAEFNCLLHVGQEDFVRGATTRYGRSTHSLIEVSGALNEKPGPEYIGFGAMFPSRTKPEVEANAGLVRQVTEMWEKEIVLIGGISLENIHQLPAHERIYYAIISDFFAEGNCPENIQSRVKKLLTKTQAAS